MCFGSVQSDCLRDKITNNGSISLAFGTFSLLTINKKETTMVWMTLIILIGVALIAVGIILSFYRNLAPGDRFTALTLGLILGGAIGNLLDRIFRAEVVDFLHFRLWSGYSWPDFNFADSFIVVGVALLLLQLIAAEGESRAGNSTPEPGT